MVVTLRGGKRVISVHSCMKHIDFSINLNGALEIWTVPITYVLYILVHNITYIEYIILRKYNIYIFNQTKLYSI